MVELADDADPRARYCSLRCRKAARYVRERGRDAARTVALRPVEPVDDPFVELDGEASWSRSFRANVWLGQAREASRIWDYRVSYGVDEPPSKLAVEVAARLRLKPLPSWRQPTSWR